MTLNIKLNFLWDDGVPEVGQCLLNIPESISALEVAETLQKEHKFLCEEDDEDRYGFCGRTPDTLLDYVCEKNNWDYSRFSFDIDLDFQ